MRDNHPDIRRVGHIQIIHQDDGYKLESARNEVVPTEEEAVKKSFAYRDRMKLFGVNVPCRPAKYRISKAAVRALKEGGLWVSIWFVNDPENGVYYREAGADAIVTASRSNRIRATARGYAASEASVLISPAMFPFITALSKEDLQHWESYERAGHLLNSIELQFPLKSHD